MLTLSDRTVILHPGHLVSMNWQEWVPEVKEWCEQAGISYYSLDRVAIAEERTPDEFMLSSITYCGDGRIYHVMAAEFSTAEDAVMFKMRWGGS